MGCAWCSYNNNNNNRNDLQHLIIISRNVSLQKLYGAPGMKPDEQQIEAYESYTLEHCENFKLSRMLQVTVTRCSESLHCLVSF